MAGETTRCHINNTRKWHVRNILTSTSKIFGFLNSCKPVFLQVVRTAPLGTLRKCKGAVGGYALNGGAYITV
ncbi:hypothetical protein FHG87_014407 [Trinorchestia longiramus]|nr:hypothetical protein FHG87_014407 [Trinorchestia longiramus]